MICGKYVLLTLTGWPGFLQIVWSSSGKFRITQKVESNGIFIIMPEELARKIAATLFFLSME